jgi:hypothetical protein
VKRVNLFLLKHTRKHLFKVRGDDKKFKQISDVLSGKTIMDMLVDDFYVLCQVKELFVVTPMYEKYTDLDIAFTKMKSFHYPSNEMWQLLLQLINE